MHKLTSITVKVVLALLLTLTISFQAKAQYGCEYFLEVCGLDCDLTKLSADYDAYAQFSTCSSSCTQISNYLNQSECYDNCSAELDDMLLGNDAEWHDCWWNCGEEYCSCAGYDDC